MKRRPFGKTGLMVSELGMGCAFLGGDLYYRNDRESIRTILSAFDQGVNFFDTAHTYSSGRSEKILGRALKGKRDRVIISTKGGAFYSPLAMLALAARPFLTPLGGLLRPFRKRLLRLKNAQKRRDWSPEVLTRSVHTSLRRLQTDYLDIFFLHHPTQSVLENPGTFEVLDRLVEQGKIRSYGASCDTVEDALVVLHQSGIGAIQLTVNLLDQAAVEGVLPRAVRQNLGIVSRLPLARGLLADHEGESMAEREIMSKDTLLMKKKQADAFRFLVRDERTMAQSALKFVLQMEGVSVVLPGMRGRRHLMENLGAITAPALTHEEMQRALSLGRSQVWAGPPGGSFAG